MTNVHLTPKQELICTLDALWKLVEVSNGEPVALRLVQVRGLVDHARAVVQRVGQESRAPKKAVAS